MKRWEWIFENENSSRAWCSTAYTHTQYTYLKANISGDGHTPFYIEQRVLEFCVWLALSEYSSKNWAHFHNFAT